MINISTEAKVGILVLLGILILAFLTLRAGNYELEERRGYRIKVTFRSVAGLDEKARVKVSGVDSGYVENISIIKGGAELVLRIKKGIQIRENAIARIQTLGLMGEKYIEIEPGTDIFELLHDGDRITTGLDSKDIDYLTEQISVLTDDLMSIAHSIKTAIATQEGQDKLIQIIENMQNLTASMNDIVLQNQKEINKLVRNLVDFSKQLNMLMDDNRDRVAGIVTDFSDFSSHLALNGNKMLDDMGILTNSLKNFIDPNMEGIGPTLNRLPKITDKLELTLKNLHNITERLNKGEGTIGKLLTDDSVHEEISGTLKNLHKTLEKADSFVMHLAFKSEFFSEYNRSKSYISLKFQPQETKYYLLEFVDDFKEHIYIKRTTTDPSEGVVTSVEEESEDKLLISLLMAHKLGPFFLKGGLIESKGGAGLEFFPFMDNIYLGIEGWDFDSSKPHLKFYSNFKLNKYFFFNIGLDNFINSDTRSFFAGVGFTFEDNDLKYLLTKLPLPGL